LAPAFFREVDASAFKRFQDPPPRFPHILKRPRLLERLEQQRDKKLILILGQGAQGKSTLEAISKLHFLQYCHSERSEESSLFKYLDPSLALRVTEKRGFEMTSNFLGHGDLRRLEDDPIPRS